MSDWMEDAVKRTKEKFGAQQVADEKFVHEQKLKHELGQQFFQRAEELAKAVCG